MRSTVAAIPLLLDRDRDFVTALITSWQTVIQNPKEMIAWGLIVTAAVMVGMGRGGRPAASRSGGCRNQRVGAGPGVMRKVP